MDVGIGATVNGATSNTSVVGQTVVFSAGIAPADANNTCHLLPNTSSPVGNIDYFDGSTRFASVPLEIKSDASAETHAFNSTQTSLLAVGAHTIKAVYKSLDPNICGYIGGEEASIQFTVTSAGATQVTLSAPASALSGVSFNFTATAQDQANNTVTNYTGTLHFTSTDSRASLPADYTFIAADNGTHTFNATLNSVGSWTITATDSANNSITGVSNKISTTGPPKHFALSAPTPQTAGAAFNLTVTVQDQNNNTVTGYSGTVHFTSSDPQAVLPANYTFTAADKGTHTFSATLKTSGNDVITATDTADATISGSAPVTVNPGAVNSLSLTAPGSAVAGAPFNFSVRAVDSFGNVVTGFVDAIHFVSSGANAKLPADYTFLTADQGSHSFSATLNTPGNQTIAASDIAHNAVQGASNVINVTANSIAISFTTAPPANLDTGTMTQMSATVANDAPNPPNGVHWTVLCGSVDCGSFNPADTASGAATTYTSPASVPVGGTVTITAASKADSAKSVSQNVTIISVNNPVPGVTQLNPPDALAGEPNAFVLTVGGTNFIPASVVNFNKTPRATTFVDANHLAITLSAADVANAATLPVTVTNPPPGGGTSSPSRSFFIVNAPQGALGSLVSENSSGTSGGNGASSIYTVSATGRYVTFESTATDLISGGGPGSGIYSRDTCVGAPAGCVPATQIVDVDNSGDFSTSVTFDGADATGQIVGLYNGAFLGNTEFISGVRVLCGDGGLCPSAQYPGPVSLNVGGGATGPSPDGRYLLEHLQFANPPGLYLHDSCVGIASGCAQSDKLIEATGQALVVPVTMSSGAQYILFQSQATNQFGVTSPAGALYLYNVATATAALVSLDTDGSAIPADSVTGTVGQTALASISLDGRYVVFYAVTNLTGIPAILERDTCTGAPNNCTPTTVLESLNPAGNQIASGAALSLYSIVSFDGRFVAFIDLGTSSAAVHDTCLQFGTNPGAVSGCTPKTVEFRNDAQGNFIANGVVNAAISGDGHYVLYVYAPASSSEQILIVPSTF